MKFIKSYDVFSSVNEELDIDIYGSVSEKVIDEISDIFLGVHDSGLRVDNIYVGHALSIGDREIVTDHTEFETILGPDGHYVGSYKSLSIRLKAFERNNFNFDNDLYNELKSAIGHLESEFDLQLGTIYLRTFDGVWFNNVDTMEKYINELPFAKRSSLRHVSYLDLTFKILNDEDVDDSVSVKESNDTNKLESIYDDIKDILKDLEDEHELEVDMTIGQYHKMYSAKRWQDTQDSKLIDSINIDLKDIKYNFFRFNEHILPTINTLKSFLKDYDLNIDIELVSENEFYTLDDFIGEYGSEEFHELGIIIY